LGDPDVDVVPWC